MSRAEQDETHTVPHLLSIPARAQMRRLPVETPRLTLVPIDKTLVDRDMLSEAEISWWNAYHARVLEMLAPQLDGEDLAWLERACEPL